MFAIRRFPKEIFDLFSAKGRRTLLGRRLQGSLSRDGRRFLSLPALMDGAHAQGCLTLLEKTFPPLLRRMESPIPAEATWSMARNYSEQLPKTARVFTAMLESRHARAYARAEEVGLVSMLRSESFHTLAQALNGRPLRRRWGIQLLCYGARDSAGPHNDHHPEDEEAKDGYLDVHLTFANSKVKRQLLVYEKRGHFTEVVDVRTLGGITAYRLPFWHYTTPLEPNRGQDAGARRWVLLGTFLDKR